MPCWKFAFMGVVMVLVLMVVVTKANISTTITTQRPPRKADQNVDGNEIKICATNGTDFVSFPNERQLKELNRKEGITAFKKVALASCSTFTSEKKSANNHPVVKTITMQSKISNEPKSTTTHPILKLVYNVTPMGRRFKKVNKLLSATIRPILRSGDKVTPKTIRTKKLYQNTSTTISPKHVTKILSMAITPHITPLGKLKTRPVLSPSDKIATTTILSIAKQVNSVTPLDEVMSRNAYPVFPPKDDVKPITIRPDNVNIIASMSTTANIKPLGETITSVRQTVIPIDEIVTNTFRSIDIPVSKNTTIEKVMPTKFYIKKVNNIATTTIRPMSTTVRPIFTTVSQVESTSIHLKNSNNKEALIDPNIKPVHDKIGTSTIRPIVNKDTTNFRSSKVTPVNNYRIVNPVYPEATENIRPLPMQMEARKSISCPHAFNPVCATHGGVNSTFINECLVNAEKVKTGKDWTIIKEGPCNVEKIEDKNPQHKDSTEGQSYNTKENYENSPTVQELAADNIMFAPIIERTEYEDGPIVEHSYPSYGATPMTNLGPYNTQFFPSYGTPEMENFKQKNKQIFPSNEVATITNFRPNDEQSFSSHRSPAMTNFESSKQSFPSHGTPSMTNFALKSEQSYLPISKFRLNNEIFYPLSSVPAMTNFKQKTEGSYPAYKDQTMMGFENKQYNNPISSSQQHFMAPIPLSYPISDNDIEKQITSFPQIKTSIEKRHAKHLRKRKYLPCAKTFNPVCAIYAGVKSTFDNECLVNAENIKTGSAWTVFSRGVCAEEYASSSYRKSLRTILTRRNDENLYKAPKPIEQKYVPQNYELSSEQKIFKNSNDYSLPLPGRKNYQPIKWYALSSSAKKKFDSKYNEPAAGVQFERFEEHKPLLFRTNSYSPLSLKEKNVEGSLEFLPDILNPYKMYTSASAKTKRGPPQGEGNYVPPEYSYQRGTEQNAPPLPIVLNFDGALHYGPSDPVVPNFEASAEYEPSLSSLDSTNHAPPFERVSTENPNKYAPLSSSEEIGYNSRPSDKKKPTRVADENVPINKVPMCSFGAAQLPICGSYNNKRQSFGNICELMFRNILRNETWAPIYQGRCRYPEVCTLGIEPICVSRNGIMETVPNLCFYERLKIQDPLSSWQYHFKGECFLSPLNSAFQRLTKPVDPLTIKVPDYENTNLAFASSKLLYPLTSSTLLKYPSEYRRSREIYKSSNAVLAKEQSASTKVAASESTASVIEASSSTTKAPMITTTSYPNNNTIERLYNQITIASTKATAKLIPYKKPITRLGVSARQPNRASIYSSNANMAKMRLKKPRAFSAVNSKAARSFRQNADRLRSR